MLTLRFLLDSSAVLNDFHFSFLQGNEYLMPPKAVDECKDLRSRALVEAALASGLLAIFSPAPASLERAQAKARSLGMRLSEADLEVVAAALDLAAEGTPFQALTDDFSLQNTLKALRLPFEGVIRGRIARLKVRLKAAKPRK